MKKREDNIKDESLVNEPSPVYGFSNKSEEDRLREDIFRPDMEKLRLFTQMLRRNKTLNKAVISHSK